MGTDEMRIQVRIRDEVLTRDFSLPPRPPVIEAEEQRIEALVCRRRRVVSLKERIPVREPGRPGRILQFISAENGPCIRIQRVAIALGGVLEFEREIWRNRKRLRVGAHVEDVEPISSGSLFRIREPFHVGRAERRFFVLTDSVFVVHSPEVAARVVAREFVLVEIKQLRCVWTTRSKPGDRGKLERLARVGPVAAARAAFGRAVVEKETMTEAVLTTA